MNLSQVRGESFLHCVSFWAERTLEELFTWKIINLKQLLLRLVQSNWHLTYRGTCCARDIELFYESATLDSTWKLPSGTNCTCTFWSRGYLCSMQLAWAKSPPALSRMSQLYWAKWPSGLLDQSKRWLLMKLFPTKHSARREVNRVLVESFARSSRLRAHLHLQDEDTSSDVHFSSDSGDGCGGGGGGDGDDDEEMQHLHSVHSMVHPREYGSCSRDKCTNLN